MSAQVRDLEERFQRLQVTGDAGSGPVPSQAAIPEQANVDLERVEARLNERLEGLAAGVVSQRTELQALLQEEMRQRLEQRIEETVERLTERVEEQTTSDSITWLGRITAAPCHGVGSADRST